MACTAGAKDKEGSVFAGAKEKNPSVFAER
jgi:hypothetical protein